MRRVSKRVCLTRFSHRQMVRVCHSRTHSPQPPVRSRFESPPALVVYKRRAGCEGYLQGLNAPFTRVSVISWSEALEMRVRKYTLVLGGVGSPPSFGVGMIVVCGLRMARPRVTAHDIGLK